VSISASAVFRERPEMLLHWKNEKTWFWGARHDGFLPPQNEEYVQQLSSDLTDLKGVVISHFDHVVLMPSAADTSS
jgi:hypothetical protein